MRRRRKRKMSLYKKSLLIFTLCMLIIGEIFLIYVNNSLKEYENSNIDNYLTSLLGDIQKESQKGNITKYLSLANLNSKYEEKSDLENGYKTLLKDATLAYQKTADDTYDLSADDNVFATVKLDDSKVKHRLGLLTYPDLQIKQMISYNEDGLYKYDFYLASNYELFINNIKVNEEDLKESSLIEEYSEIYTKINLPKLNHYYIDGLSQKPDIVIKDESNQEIKYTFTNNTYYANDFYQTDDYNDAMQKLITEYNPLDIAEKWSLFLTNDLSGALHGFNTLATNLIDGTSLYKRAYSWGTGVDVTFTSIHTLDKEPFTNEKVSNFTIYNQNAFSCEVYLEKNMTLIDKQKRTDVLHEMLYFVYYDGAYRLVQMQTVA